MSLSVLTIVRGRKEHLENQCRGLMQSELLPSQWVIVGMDQDVDLSQKPSFPVRTGRVDGDGTRLPLAEARNAAASLCETQYMVFLDVDCIASPRMLIHFRDAMEHDARLWMGRATYLPAGATQEPWSPESLATVAVEHPLQPRLREGELRASDRYELFWSLCFAITKNDYRSVGGFDETFAGYGGEDTDFSFAARAAGIPFGFVGATAHHQHHTVCKPPLNHFDAIVRNSQQFRRKWGVWPMEAWLKSFAQLGLVEFVPANDTLRILRCPTDQEIVNAHSLAPAGF